MSTHYLPTSCAPLWKKTIAEPFPPSFLSLPSWATSHSGRGPLRGAAARARGPRSGPNIRSADYFFLIATHPPPREKGGKGPPSENIFYPPQETWNNLKPYPLNKGKRGGEGLKSKRIFFIHPKKLETISNIPLKLSYHTKRIFFIHQETWNYLKHTP